MELPATTDRVTRHTDSKVNMGIMSDLERRLWYYVERPDEIEQRLRELDKEWDMERTLEANASTIALAGVLLTASVSKKFLVVPGVVAAFLLQHALQGWCPPVPVFRRLGVRTQSEIELERYALKALRGDFGEIAEAVEAEPEHWEHPRKVLQALTH